MVFQSVDAKLTLVAFDTSESLGSSSLASSAEVAVEWDKCLALWAEWLEDQVLIMLGNVPILSGIHIFVFWVIVIISTEVFISLRICDTKHLSHLWDTDSLDMLTESLERRHDLLVHIPKRINLQLLLSEITWVEGSCRISRALLVVSYLANDVRDVMVDEVLFLLAFGHLVFHHFHVGLLDSFRVVIDRFCQLLSNDELTQLDLSIFDPLT